MDSPEVLTTQVTVIGSGLAGMSAAHFGAACSVQTAVVGSTGASAFSSGMLDLFGVLPWESHPVCDRPWKAIDRLPDILPSHPYTLIGKENIEKALNILVPILRDQGLPYAGDGEKNTMAVGPLGTLKPTYLLPATMLAGIRDRAKKPPGLIVDFHGLKDFSAKLVASNLKPFWPGLRTSRLTFPGSQSKAEIFTELLAHSLESPQTREQLALSLKPLIGKARVLGLPAILGLRSGRAVHQDLEERLKIRIFEIPTLPASVPGLRLKEALKQAADGSCFIRSFDQTRVTDVHQEAEGWFQVTVQGPMKQIVLKSQAVLLATGRFLGRGLTADRTCIKESLFNLPVHQPDTRAEWHREDFFDPRGHPVNRSGIEVDDQFRPVDGNAKPVYANLYAAGSILAHQDWMRLKCGAGVAIASAYKAIQSCQKGLRPIRQADLYQD